MENKKRLIDANALMAQLEERQAFLVKEYGHRDHYTSGFVEATDKVEQAPTVDAVEVVHGRWVLLAEFFDGSICTECSVCGEEYTYKKGRLELIGVEYAKYNYCPNCGAKMDGDGDG